MPRARTAFLGFPLAFSTLASPARIVRKVTSFPSRVATRPRLLVPRRPSRAAEALSGRGSRPSSARLRAVAAASLESSSNRTRDQSVVASSSSSSCSSFSVSSGLFSLLCSCLGLGGGPVAAATLPSARARRKLKTSSSLRIVRSSRARRVTRAFRGSALSARQVSGSFARAKKYRATCTRAPSAADPGRSSKARPRTSGRPGRSASMQRFRLSTASSKSGLIWSTSASFSKRSARLEALGPPRGAAGKGPP
mmetsp:Transcript_37351/g.117708  ORF Transcript_37351/g.117708 Transcript_37351/m.117708 type:complete len:252 (+) Transcript_37351:196-951(+)